MAQTSAIVTEELNFAGRFECAWLGGNRLVDGLIQLFVLHYFSGSRIFCPMKTAAFGRCATSTRSAEDSGDCNRIRTVLTFYKGQVLMYSCIGQCVDMINQISVST